MKLNVYINRILVSLGIGVACGVASAIFLLALDLATKTREAHLGLIYMLPLAGLFVGWAYHVYGKSVEAGNNLIIDEALNPKKIIPLRMAPLVLIGTVVTHLFGGSAGREGTAVQMGGSIADQASHLLKASPSERRRWLMAGMSGGFGSVFGVPFAGAIFGLEVLSVGQLHLWALAECVIASFTAHNVTLALGVHHTPYPHLDFSLSAMNLFVAASAGFAFGFAARLFALCTDLIRDFSKKRIPFLPYRAAAGGVILTLIFCLLPETLRYSGLGVPVILQSLREPIAPYDWFGKLLLTAITLGMGFKGGEVTPLLFIGAALGNALGLFLPIPLPLIAGLGLVSVFAGAANTPLTCVLMATELFGHEIGLYALVTCYLSFSVSGPRGIYHTQRELLKESRSVIGFAKSFIVGKA